MRIVHCEEFDTWLDRLIDDAAGGDELAQLKLGLVASELAVLRRTGRSAALRG